MGKTIVEKILAKAAGKSEVSPGEYVQVTATNYVMVGTDLRGSLPDQFKSRGWNKLFDPNKIIFAPEHCGSYSRLTTDPSDTNREFHRINSEFARKMGVPDKNIRG